jgi:hypothetical protein
MSPVGFEPTISSGKRPQTYALDRAATVTGCQFRYMNMEYWWTDIDMRTPRHAEKTCPNATLPTNNSKWIDVGSEISINSQSLCILA